jgi:hypothetical protein
VVSDGTHLAGNVPAMLASAIRALRQ